jgi:hypothetical protein
VFPGIGFSGRWSLGQPRWRASANLARPSSRHLPSVTTATVETWIAAAAVGCRAGHEADRYVPLRYRSIYRPSQKLPFTTGGFGSTADIRRLERARRVWRRSPPRSQGGAAKVRELAEVGRTATGGQWRACRPVARAPRTRGPAARLPRAGRGHSWPRARAASRRR